ncbi:MAG TPA: terminase family protein [Fimbriimonadales bacterium]|jgi:phage terminase large subunit-like protein|nr:terminase family protein [Fimbriimonadales bacterium]
MLEEFLSRLREASWAPHAGQLEYLKNAARFRVLACGRRWGKTDAAAADAAVRAFGGKESRQIAIAPTLAQARIIFERIKWMLGAAGIIFAHVYSPYPSLRIHEANDKNSRIIHVVDARSGHEAKNLRGDGADHILVDEAAFISESLVTEVAMPMLAANNGRMTLISTPRGRNFFHRFFAMGERAENEFWSRRSPTSENALVSPEFLELQRCLLTEAAFKTEYEAEFLDSSSAVFKRQAIDEALSAPIVPFGPVAVGIDWARYQDMTAVVAVRGRPSRAEVILVETFNGQRWSNIVARAAALASEARPNVIVCDGTGVGDATTEQFQHEILGIPVDPFTFSRSSKTTIIERLVWMLERNALRLPADVELIRQLENFEAHDDETGTKFGAAPGFHDDIVCALAMACQALEKTSGATMMGKERK